MGWGGGEEREEREERRGEGRGGGRELHGVERRFKERRIRGEGGKKRVKDEEEEEGRDKLTWSLNIHMISGSGSPSAVQPRRRGCNSVRVSGVGRVRNEGGSVGKGEEGGGENEEAK